MGKDTLDALIYILGALVALWLMFWQIKRELRGIREQGIMHTLGLVVTEADLRKLTNLVLDELDKRRRLSNENENREEGGESDG